MNKLRRLVKLALQANEIGYHTEDVNLVNTVLEWSFRPLHYTEVIGINVGKQVVHVAKTTPGAKYSSTVEELFSDKGITHLLLISYDDETACIEKNVYKLLDYDAWTKQREAKENERFERYTNPS